MNDILDKLDKSIDLLEQQNEELEKRLSARNKKFDLVPIPQTPEQLLDLLDDMVATKQITLSDIYIALAKLETKYNGE